MATTDLFRKIVFRTRASSDQEHLHIIIDNNTNIPDRTSAIIADGEDPRPQLVISARRLRDAGADFLIMPCNTAHYFYSDVAAAIDIPVLNMLDETARYLKKQGVKTVGLLATDGTIRSGVYEETLKKQGIKVLYPNDKGQREVMRVIYDGVKAGNHKLDVSEFVAVCGELLAKGAQTLVLGCTELPLAFSLFNINLPNVDPTMVLAETSIRFAGAEIAK